MKTNEQLLTEWASDQIEFSDDKHRWIMPRECMDGIARFLTMKDIDYSAGNGYPKSSAEFIKNVPKRIMDLRHYVHTFRPDLLPGITGIWLSRFSGLKEIDALVQGHPLAEIIYKQACGT